MKIALGIEYDGTRFNGWQRQHAAQPARTVQQVVEAALSKVANHPVTLICAGRTDTGVHARSQVVHFETESTRSEYQWVFGCNRNLPDDVVILWAKPVADDFHARFSALARHYRYLIYNRHVRPAIHAQQVSWQYRPLAIDKMRQAAQYLIGEHDFDAFRASHCQAHNPVRTLSHLDIQQQGDLIALDLSANAFLYHMVRNIAGSLMAVGYGKYPPEWIETVLASKQRCLADVTAPPNGLCFYGVSYPAHFQLPSVTFSPSLY